jgi:hypothetical protein
VEYLPGVCFMAGSVTTANTQRQKYRSDACKQWFYAQAKKRRPS